MPLLLSVDNDNVVELVGLTDEVTGEYVNDASCSFILNTIPDGQTVWSTTILTFVPRSDGCYRGVIESSAALEDGDSYRLIITAASQGRNARWELTCKAKTRTS